MLHTVNECHLMCHCNQFSTKHRYIKPLSLRKHAYSNIKKISPPKTEKNLIKNSDILSYFCSKHRLWVLVRTASSWRFLRIPTIYVLIRNKKNNVYPCKPQFYYIKVGFKGSKMHRRVFVMHKSRKHAFIIFTPLNPTFI